MLKRKEEKLSGAGLEQYATARALRFAGSLLVIASALKVIGIDFAPIIRAYETVIVQQIERGELADKKIKELEEKIKALEALAHEPNPEKAQE